MGFTGGFTGGAALTLSLAYFALAAHQRNRERQSQVIRAQTTLISGLTDPLPPVYPPTRAELAALQRANLIDTAKGRWNAEVEGAAHWVQETDWDEVREGVETAVGRLWTKTFGGDLKGEIEKAERRASDVAAETTTEVKKEVGQARTIATERADTVAAAAKEAYVDAKARGSEVVSKSAQKADEAKDTLLTTIGKGIEKGKEALGLATTKTQEVAGRLEAKVDDKLSPVDRVLQQRYEKSDVLTKSVEEVLAERYQPVDQKNNAVLRGL